MLKKILLLIFFLCCKSFLFAQQDTVEKKRTTRIIKLYPLQIIANREFVIGYEQSIAKKYSLEFAGSYYAKDWAELYCEDCDDLFLEEYHLLHATGFALKSGLKKYSKGTIGKGFYHGPLFIYKHIQMNNIDDGNWRYFENENIKTILIKFKRD